MGKLLNFIIIDQFKYKRQGSIYFLTHWHSGTIFIKDQDHYQGISNTWPYGPIYCSPITKRLLLSKYPKLKQNVIQLQYNKNNLLEVQVTNYFGWKQNVQLSVRIFDSNHMAGSIMILFQYQNRFYLNTGDMRFNQSVANNLTDLFQPVKSIKNSQQPEYICKFPIQKLYLDNTFCDPIFMFPPRSYALKLITKIIQQYQPKRVFLCTDSIGKQQAFVYLSKKYNCKVKISKDRLKYIKCMKIDHKKYFTLVDQPGVWIEVIRKVDKQERVSQQKNSISITLTGWANLNDYHPIGYNSFVVPYSLHSNYKQLQMFVKWIQPKTIIPIVYHSQQRQSNQFRQKVGSYESYMMSLCYIKQRGLEYLMKEYTCATNLGSYSNRRYIESGCEGKQEEGQRTVTVNCYQRKFKQIVEGKENNASNQIVENIYTDGNNQINKHDQT